MIIISFAILSTSQTESFREHEHINYGYPPIPSRCMQQWQITTPHRVFIHNLATPTHPSEWTRGLVCRSSRLMSGRIEYYTTSRDRLCLASKLATGRWWRHYVIVNVISSQSYPVNHIQSIISSQQTRLWQRHSLVCHVTWQLSIVLDIDDDRNWADLIPAKTLSNQLGYIGCTTRGDAGDVSPQSWRRGG